MARWSVFAVALLASSLTANASAKAPKRDPPLLFGGPVTKPVVKAPLDPRLPTGAALPATEPRPNVTASRCSFERPVCVHATENAAAPSLPAALSALERAYERSVLALGIPAPLGDGGGGSNDSLDFYLSAEPRELLARQEALLPGRMD